MFQYQANFATCHSPQMQFDQRNAFVILKDHQVKNVKFKHLYNGDPPKLYVNGVPVEALFPLTSNIY